MKLKLKGRRFDNIEEIQTQSQRVLDTLTGKDFRKLSKNGGDCDYAGGNYFDGDGCR
jgi:hypothetical protein